MRSRLASLPVFALMAAAWAQTSMSVWDGVYTEEQARQGASLYAAECARCHGAALNGGEMATPLVGGSFLSNWTGLTVGDLLERTRVSMPADNPGSLSRQKTADVLARVLQANGFPAGERPLSRQTEILKQIQIDARPR